MHLFVIKTKKAFLIFTLLLIHSSTNIVYGVKGGSPMPPTEVKEIDTNSDESNEDSSTYFPSQETNNSLSTDNTTAVIKLQFCYLKSNLGKNAMFSKEMLLRFHDCLCNDNSTECAVVVDRNSTVTSVSGIINYSSLSSNRGSLPFVCNLIKKSTIKCSKMNSTESMKVISIPYCTELAWTSNQSVSMCSLLSDVSEHIEKYCGDCICDNNSCYNNNTDNSTTTSSVDSITEKRTKTTERNTNKNSSRPTEYNNTPTSKRPVKDSTNKIDSSTTSKHFNMSRNNKDYGDNELDSSTIAWITAPCVIVIVIIILVVIFFHLKRRRKYKSKSNGLSSRSSKTFSTRASSKHLRRNQSSNQLLTSNREDTSASLSNTASNAFNNELDCRTNNSVTNGAARSPTNSNIYTIHSYDVGHNTPPNLDNNIYATIDDHSRIRSEYDTLGDSRGYNHLYKGLTINDPKLRPPLPLPDHVTNQPISYYSVAKPTDIGSSNQNDNNTNSSNQNIPQYLELYDENIIQNPPTSSDGYSVPI